ncbi:MAG TPA: HAMP domain-containing sensor histidine kinase [Polyangiaceae bacterium]|nr:HAMP domain-containing sensor histidine kinase [Polyangiaceae bacterium]
MMRQRERLAGFVLLPAVLVAVGVLAFFTFRTTLQVETLRQQSVLEATLGLANEKADRLDKRIIEEDNAVFAIADPLRLGELGSRWLPTAQRETPTVRAILVLDETRTVLAFASRAGGAFGEEEAFRRLLVRRIYDDMDLAKLAPDELRHLHRDYRNQNYLISYWQRVVPAAGGDTANETSEPTRARRYLVVAWHDVGRIVKDTMPALFSEAATPSRVNVVDEDGRIIFGPPLRSGNFTVNVRFPTTLYGWRVQVSPSASDELTARVRNRALLELVMVVLSCIVIVLGVATIVVAAERERRISAQKSEFVANVSHELKTPLALVRMFGEMLQSGRVTSEAKRQEYLDIIVGESERLSSLIENVLDFARVERGRQAYDFADGSVGDAVAKAVNVYRYRAEREAVDLVAEIEPALPNARIDERAIQLAVINLIDNALKYAKGTDTVIVRVTREGHALVVRVIDHGPGVPAEDRERIFERFVRGSTARGADGAGGVRGSGIGLSLVKHIVESHGGRVWVETAENGLPERAARIASGASGANATSLGHGARGGDGSDRAVASGSDDPSFPAPQSVEAGHGATFVLTIPGSPTPAGGAPNMAGSAAPVPPPPGGRRRRRGTRARRGAVLGES